MPLEVMIQWDWWITRKRSIWRMLFRREVCGSRDTIHYLTRNCANVEIWVQHGLPRDKWLAGSRRRSILGWCSRRCMLYAVNAVHCVRCTGCLQYSVYAVLGVCCTRCMLYSVYAVLGVCWTRFILYSVHAVRGDNSWSWHGEIESDD